MTAKSTSGGGIAVRIGIVKRDGQRIWQSPGRSCAVNADLRQVLIESWLEQLRQIHVEMRGSPHANKERKADLINAIGSRIER